MPTLRNTLATLALLVSLLSPTAYGKPLDLPEDLLPRATLEKIYAAELPGYDPAQYDTLYKAHVWLEKYFLTDSAEDRRAITKILLESKIPPATLGRMCRIRLAWPALPPGPAYVNERIGPHDVQYFLGVPAHYDRAKPWPLVIRLPALNTLISDLNHLPKADEVVQRYSQWTADELKAHPDALVLMPLINFDELYGPSYKGMNTVMQALHHVAGRVNVDPKRVYMLGHGMAGHATWNLALHYPTYFAAINPLAGAASADWQRVRLLNLKNTLPVVWSDTTDKIVPPTQSSALVTILKNFKYEVVFEQTKTLGHAPSPEIAEKCYQAMRGRTRNLYPQQVNLRSTRPDPTFNRVDWVQVYQPLDAGKERSLMLRRGTGRLIVNENALTIQAAFTTPNRIEAKTDNVAVLRFYLNDQMVDLAKPLTVVVNNKTRYEGPLTVNLDEMLKDQLFLGRGWRYFTAVVDIDLAPPASSTQPSTRAIATTNAAQLFFTNDDGRTYFPLEATYKPPFVKDDKTTVRAHVYAVAGGKPFVAYLSKFSPISPDPLVKRPGETRWLPITSPDAAPTLDIKPPAGTPPGKPVEIFPEK
jgi:predicted esterase